MLEFISLTEHFGAARVGCTLATLNCTGSSLNAASFYSRTWLFIGESRIDLTTTLLNAMNQIIEYFQTNLPDLLFNPAIKACLGLVSIEVRLKLERISLLRGKGLGGGVTKDPNVSELQRRLLQIANNGGGDKLTVLLHVS